MLYEDRKSGKASPINSVESWMKQEWNLTRYREEGKSFPIKEGALQDSDSRVNVRRAFCEGVGVDHRASRPHKKHFPLLQPKPR